MQPSTRSPAERPLGVVLAGGRSRRLGVDKTRLEILREGSVLSLVEWAARRLEPLCHGVVLAGPRELAPGDLPAITDGPAPGPAGGVLGAALTAPGRSLLVLACDLPWLPVPALERLAVHAGGDLVLYRSRGGLEPLCALWRPRALARLEARCTAGEHSLWALAEDPALDCFVLDARELPRDAFFNLNRPEDLARFLARERSG